MGESLSKGAVAHPCIFINCFGVAASKKLEEGTLGQRDPKQAKTAGKFKGFFASMAARSGKRVERAGLQQMVR